FYRLLEASSRPLIVDVSAEFPLDSQSLGVVEVFRGACMSVLDNLQTLLDFTDAAETLCQPWQKTTHADFGMGVLDQRHGMLHMLDSFGGVALERHRPALDHGRQAQVQPKLVFAVAAQRDRLQRELLRALVVSSDSMKPCGVERGLA